MAEPPAEMKGAQEWQSRTSVYFKFTFSLKSVISFLRTLITFQNFSVSKSPEDHPSQENHDNEQDPEIDDPSVNLEIDADPILPLANDNEQGPSDPEMADPSVKLKIDAVSIPPPENDNDGDPTAPQIADSVDLEADKPEEHAINFIAEDEDTGADFEELNKALRGKGSGLFRVVKLLFALREYETNIYSVKALNPTEPRELELSRESSYLSHKENSSRQK